MQIQNHAHQCRIQAPQGGKRILRNQIHHQQPEQIQPAEQLDGDAPADDQRPTGCQYIDECNPQVLRVRIEIHQRIIVDENLRRLPQQPPGHIGHQQCSDYRKSGK